MIVLQVAILLSFAGSPIALLITADRITRRNFRRNFRNRSN